MRVKNHMSSEKKDEMINHVKYVLKPTNWALFSNGTFVIIHEASNEADLIDKAINYMKRYGVVHAGSQAGDFNINEIFKEKLWLVGFGSWAEHMYTLVYPEDLEQQNHNHLIVGMCGRTKRHKDSQELKIIHTNINQVSKVNREKKQ